MNKSSLHPQIKLCERTRPVFVIGIGSPHGDDRAGWEVVDRLDGDVSKNIFLRKAAVPHDILDWLDNHSPTHIIDASCDNVPGLQRFNITQDEAGKVQLSVVGSTSSLSADSARKSLRSSSSHQLDLLSAIELAATLHRLPRQLTLWTISISSVEKNGDVGVEMQERINECVTVISKELCYA
jgi:hydrogenase maturation protease